MSDLQKTVSRNDHLKTKIVRGKLRIFYAGSWRSQESAERKRAADNLRKRKQYHSSEIIRAAQARRKKRQREENPEKHRERGRRYYAAHRAKHNAQRLERRRKNIERERERQKRWYEQNRDVAIAKIYAGRDRNNPSRVIRRLQKQLTKGDIDIHEFVVKVKQSNDEFTRGLRKRRRSSKTGGWGRPGRTA